MNTLHKIALFLLFSQLAIVSCYSQSFDFTGNWQGTATWGVQNFNISINLAQDIDSLRGDVFIQSKNQSKFAKYPIVGVVNNGVAIVTGKKYIAKKGLWCLPRIQLVSNGNLGLVGKWKANPKLNGCYIAGVGKLTLTKVLSANPSTQLATANRTLEITEDDDNGNMLVTELQKRRYYALIIAEQSYKDPSIIDLDQPIADAKGLQDVLVTHYSFEPKDVILLQNPTRTQIIETFDNLTTSVTNTDNLFIFYAGHGIWDDKIEQGYWLPSDAKKSSKAAWLSNGTIRDYIRAIDSKHTLLITDACFSGGILKTREAFTASKAILELYKLPSRKAMTSGSLKTVPDKSVFIEYLIKALKNNNQPLISADQLFNSFKYNVINNSSNGQVPQYGVISQADDEGGDFIFLKK